MDVLLAEEIDVEPCGVKRQLDGEHGPRMSGDVCPDGSKKRKRKPNKHKSSKFKPGRILIEWLMSQFRAMLLGREDILDEYSSLMQWWHRESTQAAFIASVDIHRRDEMAAWMSEMGPEANPTLTECRDARFWTVFQNIRGPTGPLQPEDSELRIRLDGLYKVRATVVKDLVAAKQR